MNMFMDIDTHVYIHILIHTAQPLSLTTCIYIYTCIYVYVYIYIYVYIYK